MLHQFILYFDIGNCKFGKAIDKKNLIFQCFYNGNIKNFRKELNKSIIEVYNILKYKYNKYIFMSKVNSTDLVDDSDIHYKIFNEIRKIPYTINKSKHRFTRGLNHFVETLIKHYDSDYNKYNEIENSFIDVIKEKIEIKSFKMVNRGEYFYKEGYLSVIKDNFLIM